MPELLLELGCEELPASFVPKAYRQLEQEILARLDTAGISHHSSTSMGTPRRLIVQIEDVIERQPDTQKIIRGPSAKAAYDANRNPTPALLGFCKGQKVDLNAVYIEGEHVWAKLDLEGKPTLELLKEILPSSILSLTFDKTMRWGASRVRFARPIRWILASFGGQLIPFSIEHVQSGLSSYGHRFNAPGPFEANSFDELLAKLRERDVEPDPKIRSKQIQERALAITSGAVHLSPELVEENVFLTESPKVLEGTFPEQYLKLPEEVLITVMAKHQRFFPVFDREGHLTNGFISVYNSGVEEAVRQGNTWVLNSRFNDADFFFQEDSKLYLSDFLSKTERVIFYEKLGTIRQRAARLETLCEAIAILESASEEEVAQAKQAGLYAKADLSTGLVSELPELQGVVGAKYAKRDGFSARVCQAIENQYSIQKTIQYTLKHQDQAPLALLLLLADQVDKLTGYLGLDITPSGSSDPFGLRRAATYLILGDAFRAKPSVSYQEIFKKALETYDAQGFKLDAKKLFPNLKELFMTRYKVLLSFDPAKVPCFVDRSQNTTNLRYQEIPTELIDATFSRIANDQLLNPSAVLMRLKIMQTCTLSSDYQGFIQAATRTINIVQAALQKGTSLPSTHEPVQVESLESETGAALLSTHQSVQGKALAAVSNQDAHLLLENLLLLEKPIHAFFEATMVMADDPKVQQARLHLLRNCSELLLMAGDFAKLNL